MKKTSLILIMLIALSQHVFSQNYPAFGPEKKVTINGLTFDAMEPFISPDGNTLFFNSLNSGGNTNLYYATKVNDTTFTYVGLVGGAYDSSPDHLDAVASQDSLNNFFWTSLRGYPSPMENLHRGIYSGGSISGITRVYGDFNIYEFNYPFGWLIMDAAINYQGNLLYSCNAKFDFSNTTCVGVPCESKIGVAQKINDSTFNKLANSDAIFSNINDTVNYLVYAPQVTKDGLELYYTRLQKGTYNTEICISVRNSITDAFSLPEVIHSNLGFLPEAATVSTNKQIIYYHQKDGTGMYQIYLRYRSVSSDIDENMNASDLNVYPNPVNNTLHITLPYPKVNCTIIVSSVLGQELIRTTNNSFIDMASFATGVYFLTG